MMYVVEEDMGLRNVEEVVVREEKEAFSKKRAAYLSQIQVAQGNRSRCRRAGETVTCQIHVTT